MTAEHDALRAAGTWDEGVLDRLRAEAAGNPALTRDDAMLATVEGDVASLIRALHERAQQAESTRDAAQARATACEERARRAEAERDDLRHGCHAAYAMVARLIGERDEWRAVAEEGAAIVRQTFPADTQIGRWAAAVPIEDPAAGTGDHEREPGRMGE